MRKKLLESLYLIFLMMTFMLVVGAISLAAQEPTTSEGHTHNWDLTTWISGDTTHWHACLSGDCEEKTDEAPHTGGTHQNGGVCTVCGKKYQNHSNSYEVSSYTTTAEKHTANYACTCEGCAEVYQDEAEDHSFGVWENVDDTKHGRTCFVCSYYEESAHTGGTHFNGGICTMCSFKYQEHGIDTENIVDYEYNEVGHAIKYGCICPGCTNTYLGDAELHVDANSDGVCDICGYDGIPSSDIEPPVGTITLKDPLYTMDGRVGTVNGTVTLQISAEDQSEVTHMALTNENNRTAGALTWVPFAEEVEWTLSPGDGVKTVYLMLKDEHGNASFSFVE